MDRIISNSFGEPEEGHPLREKWSDAARASALAARKRRGVGDPILAKPLGRGYQPGRNPDYSGPIPRPIPRSTKSYHYPEATTLIRAKYEKHDVVNPETGEVRNPVASAHIKRFTQKVARSAWRATKQGRKPALPIFTRAQAFPEKFGLGKRPGGRRRS